MSDEPLVSILLPTFRRPRELRRALDSVLAQTYANLEILIANNDCNDNETNELCREVVAKDVRVSYHAHPVNIGGWANNSFLMNAAKGKYALMMNDDDWISDNFIELTLRVLQSELQCVTAQGGYVLHNAEGRSFSEFLMDDIAHEIPIERIIAVVAMRHDFPPVHGLCRTDHAREALFSVQDEKARFGEDVMYAAKIAYLGNIRNIPGATYNKSRLNEHNISYYADFFNTPNINARNFSEYIFFGIIDSIACDSFYEDRLDRRGRMRLVAQITAALFPKMVSGVEYIKGIKCCLRYLWRQPFALFKKKAVVMLEAKKNYSSRS